MLQSLQQWLFGQQQQQLRGPAHMPARWHRRGGTACQHAMSWRLQNRVPGVCHELWANVQGNRLQAIVQVLHLGCGHMGSTTSGEGGEGGGEGVDINLPCSS